MARGFVFLTWKMEFSLKSEIMWNTIKKKRESHEFSVIRGLGICIFRIWLILTQTIFHALDHAHVLPVKMGSHLIFKCKFNFWPGFRTLFACKLLGQRELPGLPTLELTLSSLMCEWEHCFLSFWHLTNTHCAHILYLLPDTEMLMVGPCPHKEAMVVAIPRHWCPRSFHVAPATDYINMIYASILFILFSPQHMDFNYF